MNRIAESVQRQSSYAASSVRILRGTCARFVIVVGLAFVAALAIADTPTPLLDAGHPVDWWFVFKFNSSAAFRHCGGSPEVQRVCPFGGTPFPYKKNVYGQQFVYASSDDPSLQKGAGCVGETSSDPIGATFGDVYNKPFFYVVWNDQFYNHPKIAACLPNTFCGAPWGHSKGILVWDDTGEGMVMQVTTPSWPGAASSDHPRKLDGNTLGCVADNDVLVSQHFFALKLTKDDVVKVLQALQNASAVTDPGNESLVNTGGPADIQALVASLGTASDSITFTKETLSSGVELISKPSKLLVPPWQFVSAVLGGVSLRTATWWQQDPIPTTTASKKMGCWDPSLGKPGRVEIATTGNWEGTVFGLTGAPSANYNHAKIGVSISNTEHIAILGDMNQEGAITSLPKSKCAVRQNARGGMFFVVHDVGLTNSLTALIDGDTAPTKLPAKPTQ